MVLFPYVAARHSSANIDCCGGGLMTHLKFHQPTVLILGVAGAVSAVGAALGYNRAATFCLGVVCIVAAYIFFRTDKQAIGELDAVKNRTNEAERRLEAIAQNSAFALFLADSSGRIVEANPPLATLLAYPQSELLGKNLRDLVDDGVELDDHAM